MIFDKPLQRNIFLDWLAEDWLEQLPNHMFVPNKCDIHLMLSRLKEWVEIHDFDWANPNPGQLNMDYFGYHLETYYRYIYNLYYNTTTKEIIFDKNELPDIYFAVYYSILNLKSNI